MIRFLHLFLALLAFFAGNAQAVEIGRQINLDAERPKPVVQSRFVPESPELVAAIRFLISITDPKGRDTRFSYDHLGRQLSRSLPGNRTESQTYDSFGHLKTRKDFQGRITEMVYDTLGRTTQRLIFANQSAFDSRTIARQVKWNYDALGRLASLEEPRGTSSFSYDLDGRLATLASPEGTINYGYDAFGRKIRTWTLNSDIRYDYDSEGRLAQVAVYKQRGLILAQPETTKYLYDEATGQRSGVDQSNGVATRYSYDLMGRLTGLSHKKASELLASYTYSLRADGRRSGVTEKRLESSGVLSQTSISYTYDELNRLTQEASTSDDPGAVFQTSYQYDLCGNRVKKATAGAESISYTYNAADQLLKEASTTRSDINYGYDAGGNLTSKNGGGETAAYAYDLEGRMVTAEIDRIEQGKTVTAISNYAYNLAGTRVGAVTNGNVQGQGAFSESRKFLVDEANFTGYSQVLEEFDGSGALSRSYVIGDDILSQNRGNGSETLLADGHGSTRLLTHSSGTVMERYSFDAYGVLLGGNKGISNRAGTNYLYSGEEYDDSLQMQYLRARYYDQNTGSFNALDPFEGNMQEPQSYNKYGYCHSDPVNGCDPTGEYTLNEIMVATAVASMVGLVTGAVIGGIGWGWDGAFYGAVMGFLSGLIITPLVMLGGGALFSLLPSIFLSEAGGTFAIGALFSGTGIFCNILSLASDFKNLKGREKAAMYASIILSAIMLKFSYSQANNSNPAVSDRAGSTFTDRVRGTFFHRTPAGVRTRRDIDAERTPTTALNPVGRTVSGTPSQNRSVALWVKTLQMLGPLAKDIRVDQAQVNAAGTHVGHNRPDLQFTLLGKRINIEWDRTTSGRGVPHASRSSSNDPDSLTWLFWQN